MVAVTLVSRRGYFHQEIDTKGRQIEQPDAWEPEQWATPLAARVALNIGGHQVWVGGWLYILEGHLNGRQPIILLDTDLDENRPEGRTITDITVEGLARSLGIAKAGFYWHFKNRDDLLKQLLNYWIHELTEVASENPQLLTLEPKKRLKCSQK